MRRLLLTTCLSFTSACGVEIGNPKNPTTGTNPTPQNIIADNDTASELLSSSVEAALAAATERFSEGSDRLRLAWLAAPLPVEECAEDSPSKVTYTRTLAGDVEREVGRPLFARIYATTLDDSFAATWTAGNDALSCSPAKRPRTNLAGATDLKLTLAYEKKRSSAVRVKRTGEVKRQSEAKLEGTRTITFEPLVENGALTGLHETIAEEHHRTLTFTSQAAGTKTFDATIRTKEDGPFQVELAGQPAAWTEKTIRSGVLLLKTTEGLYGELTWKDVTITKGEGCLPTSGTLSGAFYESDGAATPLRSFTITYAEATGLTATFDDGAALTLYPEACETE